MPNLKTYDLFLSHAWKHNGDYYRLEEMLKAAPLFTWRNYSVPVHNPVIDPNTYAGKKLLTKELNEQVRPVNCVLILSGMYAAHSSWIQEEIEMAIGYGKPIIGVRPRGQERIPRIIQDNVIEMVGWSTASIVSAVRRNSI